LEQALNDRWAAQQSKQDHYNSTCFLTFQSVLASTHIPTLIGWRIKLSQIAWYYVHGRI